MILDDLTLTDEQAATVRRLRVDEDHTWRSVAGEFADAYPDHPHADLAGVQWFGQDLCEVAAARFGEHHLEEPWN